MRKNQKILAILFSLLIVSFISLIVLYRGGRCPINIFINKQPIKQVKLNLSSSGKNEIKEFTDDLNNRISIKYPPQRIVSLAPNITEILFSLGLENRVAGVTRFCNFPEKAKQKEIVGGILDLNFEKILSLNPDLVIGTRGNSLQAIHRLKKLKVNIFAINFKESLEDLFRMIIKISEITGKKEDGIEFVKRIKNDIKKLKNEFKIKSSPKAFVCLDGKELWTAGKNTIINELIQKAGGINISSVNSFWFKMSKEEFLSKNPDIIFMMSKDENDYHRQLIELKQIPGIELISAIKDRKVFYLNEDLVSRPGPRIVEAFEEIIKGMTDAEKK
ncbi:MAG: ABC transporter substrate-binding protein [Acidobacteriota bacterium]